MKKLQILGMGCPRCNKLQELTEQAAKELGIDYSIEKVNTLDEIRKFKVMMTPALAVDGTVKSQGMVLSVEDVKKLLA